MGTMPLPPADELTETEWMDTGVQETESNQGDVAMGDSSRAHGSGSTGLTEVTKET